MKDETIAVVAGRHPYAHYGVVNTPVYRASTILFETFEAFEAAAHDPSKLRFAYGRTGTPTSASLEDSVAQLEGGAHCRLAPSGLAAITTALMAFLSTGDHLLMTQGAYPPARRFCESILKKFGVDTTFYDPLIGADIARMIRPNTKIVYVESPSSGLFEVQDVPAIASVAHARGLIVMMDNTWASPLYFKPFEHGVDVSIQAATKYIVGHSDAMLGTITCTEPMWPALRDAHRDLGQMAGPDDIYLAVRGLRTIAVRLAMHHRNGLALARYIRLLDLGPSPASRSVRWPQCSTVSGFRYGLFVGRLRESGGAVPGEPLPARNGRRRNLGHPHSCRPRESAGPDCGPRSGLRTTRRGGLESRAS